MKITHIVILFLTILFASCNDMVLNKKPLDMISDGVVWDDPVLVDAYLTGIYGKMYILTNETPYSPNENWVPSDDWNGPFIINELSDECMKNWISGQSDYKFGSLRINGGLLEWWENSYLVIRALNILIDKLPSTSLDDSFIKEKVAEARFLRAYNYFSMVKRYGGVPLILVAQEMNDPEESLYPSRDKEQVIYDFVLSEMNEIADFLPLNVAANYGRPTKDVALALASRSALYAASLAQFGTVQLNGILGVDKSKAPEYYKKSYDAAKEIISRGVHSLYDFDEDKIENFKNIFLVKKNPEAIWVVQHNYNDKAAGGNGWIWDFFQCPKPHAWDAGNQNAPYLEMVESFEYIDGRSGTLDRKLIQEGLWETEDLWKDKDPRFFASIYTMNTRWKDGVVDFHNGIIREDGTLQIDGSYEGVLAQGTQKTDGSFGTGFGVMKYLEETKSNMGERNTSGTDWQIFRFAEVLLNYAEAAYELGLMDDALSAINQIRERAGVAKLTSIDRNSIRNERKVELAFEGHRYWDLRRWRIADQELTGHRSGLRYILDYKTRKYKLLVIDKIDGGVADPTFLNEHYYFPITLSRTGNNPNLIENPGYQ